MNKTAFVAFYTVYPSNMGSSEVSSSFFESWQGKKKIFQISHLKKNNDKKIYTAFIKKESPINKIFKIASLANEVNKYLINSKKSNVIIEGPSWIGYTFFFYIILKAILPKAFFIYHSHSIEYEIRKKNSNFFISFITKIMENYIFNNVHLATSVSTKENKKIKNLYRKKTVIFPNGVNLKKLINNKQKKLLPKKYIFFSGSYFYGPNKKAIDLLNNYFMPKLIRKFPDLKLVITGGGYNFKHNWLVNLGVIPKKKLVTVLKNSKSVLVPIYEGYGTRIKIIEALMLGIPVISTPKGIEGINYKTNINQVSLVHSNRNILLKYTINVIKNNKFYKKNSNQYKKKYISIYSMEKIVEKFQLLLKKIQNDK
jgi:glycosyltransferase involved in cell wall biosynthesis